MPDINTAAWRQFTKDLQQGVKVGIPDVTFDEWNTKEGRRVLPALEKAGVTSANIRAFNLAKKACNDKYKQDVQAAQAVRSTCLKSCVDAHPEFKTLPMYAHLFSTVGL